MGRVASVGCIHVKNFLTAFSRPVTVRLWSLSRVSIQAVPSCLLSTLRKGRTPHMSSTEKNSQTAPTRTHSTPLPPAMPGRFIHITWLVFLPVRQHPVTAGRGTALRTSAHCLLVTAHWSLVTVLKAAPLLTQAEQTAYH
jgi:hypothetical protein